MVEILLVAILGALCYIASQLKRANEIAEKSAQNLSGLRSTFSAREKELRLTPEDIEAPPRESLRH